MDRSAPRYHPSHPRFARAAQAVPTSPRLRNSRAAAAFMLLMRLAVALVLVAAVVLLAPGFLLDAPQPAPRASDAIVVISGDEQMARFAEGVNLYQEGFGKYLVFSGAAFDNGTSNADVMRSLAVDRGVPESAILEEPLGEDTWGNAVYTRRRR
jgi:uncharacterized SAM-binding protein YcdF (DUF218 family)